LFKEGTVFGVIPVLSYLLQVINISQFFYGLIALNGFTLPRVEPRVGMWLKYRAPV
jgi:hypothetical protein